MLRGQKARYYFSNETLQHKTYNTSRDVLEDLISRPPYESILVKPNPRINRHVNHADTYSALVETPSGQKYEITITPAENGHFRNLYKYET